MSKHHFDIIEDIEKQLKSLLINKIEEIYGLELDENDIKVERPPRKELGDFSVPIGFILAEKLGSTGKERGKVIQEAPKNILISLDTQSTFFESVKAVGGYLNFFLNFENFADRLIKGILELGEDYGRLDLGHGETVIVEHTSANPVHPLHIGTARNAIIGDTLSRLLDKAGYSVRRHFYVNDMGKQVAYLVYGYNKLRGYGFRGKPDHWLGVIYSCVNVLSNARNSQRKIGELRERFRKILSSLASTIEKFEGIELYNHRLKQFHQRLERMPTSDWKEILDKLGEVLKDLKGVLGEQTINSIEQVMKELDQLRKELKSVLEWLEVESEVKLKWGDIYHLLEMKTAEEDVEEQVSRLVLKYERGDEEASMTFKEVCETALRGFKETLEKIDIRFDSFDWESDLVRDGSVESILKALLERGWARKEDDTNVLYLDIRSALVESENVAKIFDLNTARVKELLELEKYSELPPNLPLTRSDGTTLYTTRDIAYSVKKFSRWNAKKVYNVIGVDQTLAQKQLRAALVLAGYPEYADNQIHVAYELVTLPGKKFSSRRGRYVTFDEVFEEVKARAYEEVHKRWPEESEEEKEKTAEKIAIGAIRYALIEVSPSKRITFQWDRVLDFEQNSGPFLQYAYVRALNILKKAGIEKLEDIEVELLVEEEEKELIMKMAEFPSKIKEAIKLTRPDIIAEYANKLAQTFNKFYQKHRVLQAESEELKKARLALVKAYLITLGNAMEILGIPKLEKM